MPSNEDYPAPQQLSLPVLKERKPMQIPMPPAGGGGSVFPKDMLPWSPDLRALRAEIDARFAQIDERLTAIEARLEHLEHLERHVLPR